MTDGKTTVTRSPWAALGLSLLCTGLGHIYCGRGRLGVVLFVVALLLVPAALALALLAPGDASLAVFLVALLTLPLLYLFAVLDSFRIACRFGIGYVLRPYNRPRLYAVLAVVGILYPVGSLLIVRSRFVEAYEVAARSMEPTLQKGDRVLVDKLAFSLRDPERFELAAFRNPDNRDQCYIKRVVGLPGEKVAVEDGKIYIDGREVDPHGAKDAAPRPTDEYRTEWFVPPGHLFMLGDDLENSRDSRAFGSVPRADFIGPVHSVFWPADSFSRFGRVGR
jgi:signal peptidase I